MNLCLPAITVLRAKPSTIGGITYRWFSLSLVPCAMVPRSMNHQSVLESYRPNYLGPGGGREMADVLTVVLFHEEAKVEQAMIRTLQIERPSKQHVLNCLSR